MQEKTQKEQILTLENRKVFTLTGVTKVESSNDTTIKLLTNSGRLTISGSNLHIGKISVETGEFTLTGQIDKIEYKNSEKSGKGLSSLFH